MLARSHKPEANNKALDNNPDRIGIWGEGKTGVPGEKPLGARKRTNKKLNPQMTPGRGIKNGTHWWEASVLTTAPSRTAKSMWADDRKTFLCVSGLKFENFVFFKMYDESEHSENKFCYQGELSDAEILQLPAHSESTERKSTLVANKGIHNFLSSQHRANKRSRKKLFQMNCPILNLWNKQTDSWCETSFSGKHEK